MPKSTSVSPIILALVVAMVFAIGIVLRPLLPIDETRYLSVAWEMHLSGDYLVPTKNGVPYAHKPPLLFWLINAVWAVTGVSEFAARSVAPTFAILNLFLTYRLALKLFPGRTDIAQSSVFILISMFLFGVYTGLTMFDSLLTSATLIFLAGLWTAIDGQDRRGWIVCGFALGFGVLAKGPVILIHTVPLIVLSTFWRPHNAPVGQTMKGFGAALLIALTIVGLWIVPAVISGGEAYRNEILWTQSAGRIASAFAHERPIWFFIALAPLFLFPWSLHLGFWKSVRSLDLSSLPVRYLGIQIVFALLSFSIIASKQMHYLIPEMPALAVILATVLAGKRWRIRDNLAGLLLIVLAVALAGYLTFFATDNPPLWLPENKAFGLLTLSGFCVVIFAAIRTGTPSGMAVMCVIFLATTNLWIAQIPIREQYTLRNFVTRFEGRDGDEIAYFGRNYHGEFNFLARLSKPIYLPKTRTDLAEWAKQHPLGLVIAPIGAVEFAVSPTVELSYSGRQFGLWHTEEFTKATR